MLSEQELKDVKKLALEIRIGLVEAIQSLGTGHIGGSLSIADVLAVLYGKIMRYDVADPKMEGRDKLVCSKGHAGPGVYATLAATGFIAREELKTLNKPGTHLPSHCDMRLTNGIDMTTGSLGQGTSTACGIAYADKLKGNGAHTYLIVGDGEANEGQVWEAAMFASAKKLNNITFIVDWNKKQLDGWTEDINPSLDFEEKFRAFGFDAITVDGGDVVALENALSRVSFDKPLAVIMDTVKGKGIKDVEETMGNHSMAPKFEVAQKWIDDLQAEHVALCGEKY